MTEFYESPKMGLGKKGGSCFRGNLTFRPVRQSSPARHTTKEHKTESVTCSKNIKLNKYMMNKYTTHEQVSSIYKII